MSRINQVIHNIHYMDEMAERDVWLNHIHPLAKLLVTLLYIILVVSFDKYNLIGLAGMCLYLLASFILGEIPVGRAVRQLKLVLLAVCVIGIANPFVDREVIAHLGSIPVTGGMLSMATLVIKAVFAVFASYLLIAATSIEEICYAFQMIHVPKLLVTLILLIYRYIVLMLKEAERITQAYSLRAPKQEGIHYKVWGTLAGQMMLRSMDRAEAVYESMTLRGFDGEFYLKKTSYCAKSGFAYVVLWCLAFLVLRVFPVFALAGSIFIP